MHRAEIDIGRDSGIGDVLMLTPALRELKRVNPALHLRFYTNFPELVRGLPYIDEVLPYASAPPDRIFVEYTDLVPSPVHIARLMGDRLGVDVTNTQPDCVVDQALVEHYRSTWTALPAPRIVVLRRASRFTPNKDWPDAHWEETINELSQFGSVIELGSGRNDNPATSSGNYLDLRDRTSVAEMVAVVAVADIYVGPVSGPAHIAAAVHTPGVVIIGGYEHPVNAHYAGNIELYTQLPCSPCWLRDPCPYDLKCLRSISVADVRRAVEAIWTARANLVAA